MQNDACISSAEREEQVTKARPKGNVPALRFPEFSGEWGKYTLGDIGDTYNGLTSKSAVDFGSGSPFITYKSIFDNSKIDVSKIEYVRITDAERAKQTQNEVKYGDIFFTTSSETPNEVGMASVLLTDISDCYLNSFCFGYRIIDKVAYRPEFFRFYLHSNKVRRNIAILAQGSTRFNISKNEVMRVPINLPEYAEQRKVAQFLSLIEERISTQNKIIEKLQSLIKGIVDELMTVLLKGKLYPFSSFYIKAGEGGTPTTSVNEYYLGGTIPFIKIEDLSCKYLTSNKDFITELGMQKSSAWLIPSHSVIYSNGATIGAISINEYPICTKQGILGIVPNTNINVEYLYLLMSSSYFSKEVNRIVTEGTMKTAYLKDINHIKCPLPSMAQQQNITNLTSSIEKKLFVEQELLKLLNIQKQHLLRTMFI